MLVILFSYLAHSLILPLLLILLSSYLNQSHLKTQKYWFYQLNSFVLSFIKYINYKLVIITYGKWFSLNFWYFCFIICFYEISSLGYLIFNCRAAVVATPELLGILLSVAVILGLKFFLNKSNSIRCFLSVSSIFSSRPELSEL